MKNTHKKRCVVTFLRTKKVLVTEITHTRRECLKSDHQREIESREVHSEKVAYFDLTYSVNRKLANVKWMSADIYMDQQGSNTAYMDHI